jgi:hypothetical protein
MRIEQRRTKLLPHERYLEAISRPNSLLQMFRRPTKKVALRELRYWTGQDFGYHAEKWREWIRENVETFYAAGNNGARYTILVSFETTSTAEKHEVLRTPEGMNVIRLGKDKYKMLSEFHGDQDLITFDPLGFANQSAAD